MTTRDAFMAPGALSVVTGVTNPLPTGSEVGLCQPGLGVELTDQPLARARTAGAKPPDGVGREAGRIPFYADDFYNRIHLRPVRIDAGNLTERMAYEVEVFNAFLETATLLGVEGYGVEGAPLSGLDPPLAILALMSALGELEVTLDGPAAIDGRYVFSFTLGPDLALRIIGARIITFPLAPDWSSPVEETLLWWTDVLESRDGTEQRISMRTWPRWRLEYSVLEGGLAAGLLDSMLAGWGGRSYSLAVWHEKSRLTAPVDPDDPILHCDTANRGFQPGGLCVVWRDPLACETLEVASVAPGGITVARPASRAYDFGYVIPAKLCHLVGEECELSAVASNLLRADLAFEADEPERVEAKALPPVLDGLGLFPYRHDFASARARRLTRSMNVYDSGLALFSREDRRGRPMDSLSIEDVLLGGRAEAEDLKGFFQAVLAKAKPFWVELREDLLKVTRPIAAGSMLVHVADMAYGLLASRLPSRERLYFRTRKGWFANAVLSFADTGQGDCVLHLEKPWAESLELDDIGQVGFLIKARIDQDELRLSRLADHVARTGIELKGVAD